ncbi:MAG TPA: PIG-L family deacetylase [Roseiflexaceae bacterium]|nr:PIG-L family deacetylase [Roseiflexaceae bacterium]
MDRCLLAVYAHPDDEAFGVAGALRKYCDAGVRTALICATRGERGAISDPALATPATLGVVREGELREACRMAGVDDLTVLGYQDGLLQQADPHEAVGRLVYHIRRLRPQVVVTFDANGDYGHPDHIAIHRLTVAAFAAAGDPQRYPGQLAEELVPHAPRKLYAHAMAWSVMRRVYRQTRGRGAAPPGGGTATLRPAEMGTPDERITTLIPLDAWQIAAKLAAIRAHRTQLDPDGPFWGFPAGAVREWLEVERFRLIAPPDGGPEDADLFCGIV